MLVPTQTLQAPFVGVDVFKHGLNLITTLKPAFLFAACQSFRQLVPPASLDHESIPNLDLFLRGTLPLGEAPFEDFIIPSPLAHPVAKVSIVDTKKHNHPLIKPLAQVRMKIRMQLATGNQPNFVDHSSEINNSTNLVLR